MKGKTDTTRKSAVWLTATLAAFCAACLFVACAPPVASPPAIAVSDISLDVYNQTLSIGNTFQLTAEITPADASNKAVEWESSAPGVVTVSETGLVTAVGSGAANVKVTTADGAHVSSCDITVLAKYSVTFDTADGTAIAAQSLDWGSKATQPADPERTGYTFAGWFADSSRTDAWDFAADTITQATTIYAKWVGIDYTLSFAANGGTGTMASITVACGSSVTLPASGFTAPAGYTFTGWSVNASATYAAGATFIMPAGNCTISANWECLFAYTEASGNLTITGLTSYWPASETTLTIPEAIDGKPVTAIGNTAFYNKKTLTSVVIPDCVVTIGQYSFRDCEGLTSIDLGEGVATIKEYAFYGCTKLATIDIPASVTALSAGSGFSACSELTAINVAAANPNYASENGVVYSKDKKTLMRCPGKKTGNFAMPDTVTIVYADAFNGCTAITSITWSTNLYSIDRYAFNACTGLTSITFPASLRYINYYAFWGCTNLASVTFNDGLIQVRENTFVSTAITSLTIPASVSDFQNQSITNLTAITANASSATYSSVDGVLYSKDQKTLCVWPAAKTGTAYTVLSTVTTIGVNAFTYSKLQTITLPSGLTKIANNAITQCENLDAITIPSTVTAIGMNFGWGCRMLKTIRVDAVTPPTLGSYLPNISGLVITVPSGSVDAYKAASGWSQAADKIVSQ